MIFGWKDAVAPVVIGIFVFVVDGQHRHGRQLGVGGQKAPSMQHYAEWNVLQFGGGSVIANGAVGQHREGMGTVAEEHAISRDAEAAPAVGMVDKDQLPAIGVGLRQRRKHARLRPERFLGKTGLAGKQQNNRRKHHQHAAEGTAHSGSTPLLSPNWSISAPIRWAISSSRLLMWALALAGRLQR